MKEGGGGVKKLTVAFCLYKHLGSPLAPINNTPQISRLERRRGLLEVCVCVCGFSTEGGSTVYVFLGCVSIVTQVKHFLYMSKHVAAVVRKKHNALSKCTKALSTACSVLSLVQCVSLTPSVCMPCALVCVCVCVYVKHL